MFSLATTIVSACLIVAAFVLVRIHLRARREQQELELSEREDSFAQTQFRRRVQASGMLGVIGVAMFVGQFLEVWPLVKLFFWAGVVLLVLWMLLLALADLVVTRMHYSRLRRDNLLDQMRCQVQLKRESRGPLTNGGPVPED